MGKINDDNEKAVLRTRWIPSRPETANWAASLKATPNSDVTISR